MAEKTENKVLLEREYVIPLRREWLKVPDYKRVSKSVKAIKQFVAKHMKVENRDVKKVRINMYLNQELWFRGIRHPPAKIKVRVKKFADKVDVELAKVPERLSWQIAREAKRVVAGPKKEIKKEEKKEESNEKKEDKREKVEAVKETGLQQAKETAHQHKHETAHAKDKTQPRRMALQK